MTVITRLASLGLLCAWTMPSAARAQCLDFVSPGVPNGKVYAFAKYDDGSGPALYVTGDFTHISGLLVNGIAKWNGTQWSALGSGLSGPWRGRALCAYDDGSGSALVVGGAFDQAGGITANGIATWNGASWAPLGTGFVTNDPLQGNSRRVEALGVYDDGLGGGPKLFAGGYFNSPAHRLARWDGGSWTNLGGPLWACKTEEAAVFAFQTFDDGSGPALYIGGFFLLGSGSAIARWNGVQLQPVAGGPDCADLAFALAAHPTSVAAGGRLYAAGYFTGATSRVIGWDGSSWQPLGSTTGWSHALEIFDDGTGAGASLYADVRPLPTDDRTRLARWDGSDWQEVSNTLPIHEQTIESLYAFDDSGDGADLWIGGTFTAIGGQGIKRIAKYTGCGGLGESFCFGDGSLPTPCPCAPPNTVPNPSGAPGAGCANSFNPGGAMLSAVGATTPDTARFVCRVGGNYAGFGFLLKGSAADLAGVASHDGIRCVSGALLRVGAHNAGTYGAPLGTWTYPNNVQTLPVHVVTAQPYGEDAHYQLFYRNAVPGFCTAATANFSNAVRIGWH